MRKILSWVLASIIVVGLIPIAEPNALAADGVTIIMPSETSTLDFDLISWFSDGLARASIDGKVGLIDSTGKVVVPLIYDSIGYPYNGLATVRKDGKDGLIDMTGKVVLPVEYSYIDYFWYENTTYWKISLGEYRFSFADKSGKIIGTVNLASYQANEWDILTGLKTSGLIAVRSGNKCGFINTNGVAVISPVYDQVRNFSEDLAAVMHDGKWGFINKSGVKVIPLTYEWVGDFSDGLALVANDDGTKHGYIDKNNKFPLTPNAATLSENYIYDYADNFYNGLAWVKKDGTNSLIDKKGVSVVTLSGYNCIFWEPAWNMAYAETEDDKIGFLDRAGKVIIPAEYESLDYYEDSDIIIAEKSMPGGDWQIGVFSRTGNVIVPLDYYDDYGYSIDEQGTLSIYVCLNDKFGLYDKTGKVIVPIEYDEIDFDCNDVVLVNNNNKYGLYDKTGKMVLPVAYDDLVYAGGGIAFFMENGKWGILYVDGISRNVIVFSDTPDDAMINLADETINLSGYSVAAYSLNGGSKWKKGALPEGAKFQKLLDKGMTLWLTDKWNSKDIKDGKTVVDKKGVAADAAIIKFPKINARPKANTEKLKPFYYSEYWVLKTKNGAAATETYEWAETSNKKTPSGNWKSVTINGFAVLSGKTKTTYLLRTPPTASAGTYTPASKAFKITPVNFGKAPNYKVKTDKKTSKQSIKLKAGDWYQNGDTEPIKVSAATDLDVTGMTGMITVWKGETGKKPRTEKQIISG